ncbi:MAG: protein phosphatase 1 regulatory subunit 42 [Leptospirales bacterium]|nr:protein phosphatase 1 regulatory subunit 42 [Leptospirales bacterium]
MGVINILDDTTKLKKLEKIYLTDNNIEKIEGLENLLKLNKLYIVNNRLTKIDGLENLPRLKTVYAEDNKFTEEEYETEKKKYLRIKFDPKREVKTYIFGIEF